ncbi:hypothetical protein N7474_005008 [Penicillium riverlandense]|uniref:uncharacterized protein n=1 Tax=Penicillium riverlandense TaxID=1903569 RepID=UPI0025484AB2|nr:uncharacterized protein N7474_005008 [Penicillium riverlandense]KAJ5819417.1 hypothetical protein N7474_005008 [Penicillium riverlandense]
MSETVTESSPALTVTQILTDYEIHHSTLRPEPSDRNRAHDTSSPAPNNWPSEHRRIPPHRPINTNLDYSERGARNTAEAVFAFMMLNGCHINAVSN